MNIISTTITRNRENVISTALQSADLLTTKMVVVDMGITDATLSRVEAFDAGRGKVEVVQHAWQDHFAHARNFALQQAAKHSPDWILTVDTDEIMIVNDGEQLLKILREAPPEVANFDVSNVDGTYMKQRFFRPHCGFWAGRTHEFFNSGSGRTEAIPPSVMTFTERPKSWVMGAHKYERDLRLLRLDLLEKIEPDHRWHYYLGHVYYSIMKEFDEYLHNAPELSIPIVNGMTADGPSILTASMRQYGVATELEVELRPIAKIEKDVIAAHALWHFEQCERRTAWDEEKAFSMYLAADVCHRQAMAWQEQAKQPQAQLGPSSSLQPLSERARAKHRHALQLAERGFCDYPANGELAWLASISAFYSQQYGKALNWARVATDLSDYRPEQTLVPIRRTGFRQLFGLQDGAFGALWHAARAMGRSVEELEDIDAARAHTEFAAKGRVSFTQGSNLLFEHAESALNSYYLTSQKNATEVIASPPASYIKCTDQEMVNAALLRGLRPMSAQNQRQVRRWGWSGAAPMCNCGFCMSHLPPPAPSATPPTTPPTTALLNTEKTEGETIVSAPKTC